MGYRYAYSGEAAGEDFDKDETTLTLIKPSSLVVPSKNVPSLPDAARSLQGSSTGGFVHVDVEEDKTE